MHLNDALSRLNTHDNAVEKSKAKPVADINITIHDVEILTGLKSLSLDQVHQETECDTDMQLLKQHNLMVFLSQDHVCQSQSSHILTIENVYLL